MIWWQTQRQIQSCQLNCLWSLPSKQMLMLDEYLHGLAWGSHDRQQALCVTLSLLVHCWESQRRCLVMCELELSVVHGI